MLPLHFRFILQVLRNEGYKAELLETQGPEIIETGLKYVHNDACYPAILVIGQFISALQSGRYDPHRTALIYFQTGGGCRASNYISLLRKALERAGYGYVPVISFSLMGIERHPGFKLTPKVLKCMAMSIIYGDVLMSLSNQCIPYENHPGESKRLAKQLTEKLAANIKGRGASLLHFKQNIIDIIHSFEAIEKTPSKRIQVGVVGEIYVKYSPLGNNNLVDMLVREGAECTVPGLIDFLLYCLYRPAYMRRIYGMGYIKALFTRIGYRLVHTAQKQEIDILKKYSHFRAPAPFEETVRRVQSFIGVGCNMGEGWLLPAEMLELYDHNVKNIVCAQPFGCLPNHICGKGMMKPLKDAYPDMNIVAVDYDPSATKVNQENRIKLMLANARCAM